MKVSRTRPIRRGGPTRRSATANRRSEASFTLVEMLVVIAIISALIASMGMLVAGIFNRGRADDTKAFIKELTAGVQAFEEAFKGSGVVPDDWGSDVVSEESGGDLPELKFPDKDENLDRSSRFLAFWLGFTFQRSALPFQYTWSDIPTDKTNLRYIESHPLVNGGRPFIDDLKPKKHVGTANPDPNIGKKIVEDYQDIEGQLIELWTTGTEDARVHEPIDVQDFDLEQKNPGVFSVIENTVLLDAWKRPLRYRVLPFRKTSSRFVIVSAGADGKWNTDDDLPKPIIRNGTLDPDFENDPSENYDPK